jgi:beta-glucosidase
MKRGWKITLRFLGALILILIAASAIIWTYLKSSFLDFEDDYIEQSSFSELNLNGEVFLDRNNNGQLDIYENSNEPIEKRVSDVLSQMTLEEKLHLLKGSGISSAMGSDYVPTAIPGAVGTIVPTPRLGLPTIYLSDGPAGLRIAPTREGSDRTYYATAFPIGTQLASTWNTELVYKVGQAMGSEARSYGVDVILGPGANIHRHPFCGRNFEYFSEDPYLTGFIGSSIVNGIEYNGVGTSLKHFVANNQETNRNYNNSIVSERALREIYLKGFELVIKNSQPWTVMSSYNKVNGTYVSESRELLTDILRNDWQFDGLVMSDWFGGNDAVAMISAGNDLLEPGTKLQWDALKEGVENGTLTNTVINTSVSRILYLILDSNKMNNFKYDENPDLEKHAEITRTSANEGIILLKNNNVLPIQQTTKVALFGITSYDFISGGYGSGDVNEAYSISLEEGLENSRAKINNTKGDVIETFQISSESGINRPGFIIDSKAKSLYESHKSQNEELFVKPEGISAMFDPYNPPEIAYSQDQINSISKNTDIGMITIGRNSGEGGDRVNIDDFELKNIEKEMIKNVASAYHAQDKKVIVVLNVGGVVETASWKNEVDGIILAWQGGQEGGNSVADIISGKVNPSGKLPMTFPVKVSDHASHNNFPLEGAPMNMLDFFKSKNENKSEIKNIDYTVYEEDIYVGYRHFDKAEIEVSFPFGFGLSYTDFEFSNLTITNNGNGIDVNLNVQNIGQVEGKEVVQVYVSKIESKIDRPINELKTFQKTSLLNPNSADNISLHINYEDLRYWDEDSNSWKLEEGEYLINIGNSSRNISLSQVIKI